MNFKQISFIFLLFISMISLSNAWDNNYNNRIKINASNWFCSASNCQFNVSVSLNSSLTNGTYIQITTLNETANLSFWREDGFNGTGQIWVNSTNQTSNFLLYFANNTPVQDFSSIEKTFYFGEDCNGGAGSLNMSKWSMAGLSGSSFVNCTSAGILNLTNANGGYVGIQATNNFSTSLNQFVVESKLNIASITADGSPWLHLYYGEGQANINNGWWYDPFNNGPSKRRRLWGASNQEILSYTFSMPERQSLFITSFSGLTFNGTETTNSGLVINFTTQTMQTNSQRRIRVWEQGSVNSGLWDFIFVRSYPIATPIITFEPQESKPANLEATITFISQTPGNITTTTLFNSTTANLSIVYNITNYTGTPLLFYKSNNSLSDIQSIINGTTTTGYLNTTATSNASGIFNFTLMENGVYPYVSNLPNSVYGVQLTQLNLTSNDEIYTQYYGVQNNTDYFYWEAMFNSTSATNVLFRACNSSFIPGTVKPSNSPNCALFNSQIANLPYSHSHSNFSSHKVIPMPINATSGTILGSNVKITNDIMYFGIEPQGPLNVYVINITTRAATTQLSNNQGNAFSAQPYTLNGHAHFFNNNTLYYYAQANISGTINTSAIISSPIFETALPPTAPVISNPTSGNYYGIINITYQAAQGQADNTNISYYSIYLLNSDFSYNSTLTANNSKNLSYLWNTVNITKGNYSIQVNAYDTNGLNSSDKSLVFAVLTFNITATEPAANLTLLGNETNFTLVTRNDNPATCILYIDGISTETITVNTSGTHSINRSVASGTRSYYWNCSPNEQPSFNALSSTITYSQNYVTLTYSLRILNETINILDGAQSIFYDINNNPNLFYFTSSNGTRYFNAVSLVPGNTTRWQIALEQTKPFYSVLKFQNYTRILTFNNSATNNALHAIDLYPNGSITLTTNNGSINVTTNQYYDPFTYQYYKQYTNLTYTSSSYYLMQLPLTGTTQISKYNITGNNTGFDLINLTSNNRRISWQTIAANSNLTNWFYAAPDPTGCGAGTDKISIYLYNGINSTLNSTPDTNCYGATIENFKAGFEQYGNKTYFWESNNSARTVIYRLEDGKNYTITYNITNPSNFLFINENTFNFFSNENGSIAAYSCSFAGVANCLRFDSTAYGLYVPYDRGFMTTSTRTSGNKDEIIKGFTVLNDGGTDLIYNQFTYDVKFTCFDEQNESPKTFSISLYTNNSSTILSGVTYGYVIPSSSFGSGTRRAYTTCYNSTLRLYVVGLTGNFSLNTYGLNQLSGQYYTFIVKDQFGNPVSDSKISAYRFMPAQNSFAVVEQAITDFTGSGTLFLQQFTLYKIVIETNGYLNINFDFVPSSVTTVNINLQGTNTAPQASPDFNYMFHDVSYSVNMLQGTTPVSGTVQNATNITYQISSNSSSLEYFGMTIYRDWAGNTTMVYQSNFSAASGGIDTFTADPNGTYRVYPYFKLQNYSVYSDLFKSITVRPATGWVAAQKEFETAQPISAFGFYVIGIVITMLVVGFVSKYTIEGAGIAGLLVLWIFTLFNANAQIAGLCLTGGSCVTPLMITTLTTIGTVAALYISSKNNL